MASIFDGIFSGADFQLADTGFLGDEAELKARARQELQAAGSEDAGAEDTGADDTGVVRVSIDKDGQVHTVSVSPGWQEQLSAEGFPSALYAAYQAAQAKRVNAAALAAFAAEERGERVPSPSTVDEVHAPGDNADERAWLGEIWRVLSDNDDRLHRIARGERLAAAGTTVAGPHGFLRAQLEGGIIAEIQGDAGVIRAAGPPQLEAEALAVFRTVAAVGQEAVHE